MKKKKSKRDHGRKSLIMKMEMSWRKKMEDLDEMEKSWREKMEALEHEKEEEQEIMEKRVDHEVGDEMKEKDGRLCLCREGFLFLPCNN